MSDQRSPLISLPQGKILFAHIFGREARKNYGGTSHEGRLSSTRVYMRVFKTCSLSCSWFLTKFC